MGGYEISTELFLKEIECPVCHSKGQFNLEKLGDIQILKCRACPAKYEFAIKTKIFPKLVFDRGEREPFSYELTMNGDLIIGRDADDYDYIKIRIGPVHDLHSGENTYIRNPFVSRKHVMVVIDEEYKLVGGGELGKIVVKKKCFIKDLGSTFGTSVNNVLLEPNKLRELKGDDKIALSPNTELPQLIVFKEV